MAFTKTAISIDEELFNKAEKLSNKLHVSRSQLFSQAVEYLIDKNESLDIIKRLNEVYSYKDVPDEQKNIASNSKKRMKGIVDKW
jgi:metal-responsive CopG/Arc/MetJ family transcriptional regulator